jgi:molybdenum-dependent DNA-binding transcriptional regulator ModE
MFDLMSRRHNPFMDKFRRMQTFVRIVEHGSLTAAARALDVSQPWRRSWACGC